jgi:hypothetical protein
MKLKAYIAILLGVLVLSLPVATYANVQTQSCEMPCCDNQKTEKGCCEKEQGTKDCCGSKSHCNCMVLVACSAFVFQDNTWTPKPDLLLVENKNEYFSFSFPTSVSSAIWQPPKFLF